MVDWRSLEAAADRKIGGAFGESVRLSFLKNEVADPGRPMLDFRAVLHVAGDTTAPVGNGFATRLAADEAELIIDRSTYSGSPPARGDKVRANDRAGQPWWEVAEIKDRFSNLIVLRLTQA